jgi:hypothetical protein
MHLVTLKLFMRGLLTFLSWHTAKLNLTGLLRHNFV